MLIGRYSVLAKDPGRSIGGGAIGLGMNRGDFNKTSQSRARFTHDGADPRDGVPAGYPPGYTWVMPQDAGTMSARNTIVGTGTLAADLASGINLLADLDGQGALALDLALVISLAADLDGSGSVSAALDAIAALTAALSGDGSLTAALEALAFMDAALTGTGTLTAAGTGLLHMSADIQPFTELSPTSLANAVWEALTTEHDFAGTMGEKLNDAGSAGNPWATVIEGTYTAEELLRLMAAAMAGKVSGAGTVTVTIRDVSDTKDRIVATVDADGNRSAITLDVT